MRAVLLLLALSLVASCDSPTCVKRGLDVTVVFHPHSGVREDRDLTAARIAGWTCAYQSYVEVGGDLLESYACTRCD